MTGLQAVETHITSAVRHHTRGKLESDYSLFTDVIHRCNRAFEGSLREDYKVLADKDPRNLNTSQIENYLTTTTTIRPRIIDGVTNYRKFWRNPSSHDHILDFDEDEALLAIVSVTAFAIVLCDQIERTVSRKAASELAATLEAHSRNELSLLDAVADAIISFPTLDEKEIYKNRWTPQDYTRLVGSLSGFIAFLLDGSTVSQDYLMSDGSFPADIHVRGSDGKVVIVEVKVSRTRDLTPNALEQADYLLSLNDVNGVVIFMYDPNQKEYRVSSAPNRHSDLTRLVVPLTKEITWARESESFTIN